MDSVFFDAPFPDEERRRRLYEGQLFVFSPRPSVVALRDFARKMIEGAFSGLDPVQAQFHLPVEDYVAILARLKPAFIHAPACKELLRAILRDLGCDLAKTYFDVPRLRTSTSGGYLTSGLAYAFHPHRDTWYSAPQCQLNWWFPVYEIEPSNGMAFHLKFRFGLADSENTDLTPATVAVRPLSERGRGRRRRKADRRRSILRRAP